MFRIHFFIMLGVLSIPSLASTQQVISESDEFNCLQILDDSVVFGIQLGAIQERTSENLGIETISTGLCINSGSEETVDYFSAHGYDVFRRTARFLTLINRSIVFENIEYSVVLVFEVAEPDKTIYRAAVARTVKAL